MLHRNWPSELHVNLRNIRGKYSMKPWRTHTYTHAMELVDFHLKGSVQPQRHDGKAHNEREFFNSIARSLSHRMILTSFVCMKCTQKAFYVTNVCSHTNVCYFYFSFIFFIRSQRTQRQYGCCSVVWVSNTETARIQQALAICV